LHFLPFIGLADRADSARPSQWSRSIQLILRGVLVRGGRDRAGLSVAIMLKPGFG
jgi:hypothetical protein